METEEKASSPVAAVKSTQAVSNADNKFGLCPERTHADVFQGLGQGLPSANSNGLAFTLSPSYLSDCRHSVLTLLLYSNGDHAFRTSYSSHLHAFLSLLPHNQPFHSKPLNSPSFCGIQMPTAITSLC